jgi:hypothetical protein
MRNRIAILCLLSLCLTSCGSFDSRMLASGFQGPRFPAWKYASQEPHPGSNTFSEITIYGYAHQDKDWGVSNSFYVTRLIFWPNGRAAVVRRYRNDNYLKDPVFGNEWKTAGYYRLIPGTDRIETEWWGWDEGSWSYGYGKAVYHRIDNRLRAQGKSTVREGLGPPTKEERESFHDFVRVEALCYIEPDW